MHDRRHAARRHRPALRRRLPGAAAAAVAHASRTTSSSGCRAAPPAPRARRASRSCSSSCSSPTSARLRPRQISGGMAQRASLARALARNPGVLAARRAVRRARRPDPAADAGPAARHPRGRARDHPARHPRRRRGALPRRPRRAARRRARLPRELRRHHPLGSSPCPGAARATAATQRSPTSAPSSSRGSASPPITPPTPSEDDMTRTKFRVRPAHVRRDRRRNGARPHRLRRRGIERRRPSQSQRHSEGWSSDVLNIDFATYNPLSLIIKDQGWLEEATGGDVTVNWIQSAGSNKANEALRAGAIDVGSTAGSRGAARALERLADPDHRHLLAAELGRDPRAGRTRRSPTVEDLEGKSIAATKGTDPYFFLLQTLDEAGLDPRRRQRAEPPARRRQGGPRDRRRRRVVGSRPAAVDRGGDRWLEDHLRQHRLQQLRLPERDRVVHHRVTPTSRSSSSTPTRRRAQWAIENPEETAAILAEVAGIDLAIAESVLIDRTNLDVDPAPGDEQLAGARDHRPDLRRVRGRREPGPDRRRPRLAVQHDVHRRGRSVAHWLIAPPSMTSQPAR